MMMFNVHTIPCPGCGSSTIFVMTEDQFFRFQSGEHVQHVFPGWSDDDREMLISGTCPNCFEEMFPEEEDYWDEDWFPEDDSAYAIDPESDLYEYSRDWYVED